MATLPSVSPLVEIALKEIGVEPLTTQVVLRISARLAQAVTRWPNLKGTQKAEMVIGALRELLDLEQVRGKLTVEEQGALRVVVDTVVPETLTLLVAAGRGEFDFRKPTPGCMAALVAALCRTGAAIAVAAAPGNEAATQAAGALQAAASVATLAASEKEAPEAVENASAHSTTVNEVELTVAPQEEVAAAAVPEKTA